MESLDMLVQVVMERYRYIEGFFDFGLGEFSGAESCFRSGTTESCHGRTSSDLLRPQFRSSFVEMVEQVVVGNSEVSLPFKPTELIDNLRLERYAKGSSGFHEVLRRLYYLLRPLTTPSVRKWVQRFHARNWPKREFPHWPVDTTVESLYEHLVLLALRSKGVEHMPFVWFWPDGATGCLTMTHDVETERGRDFCGQLMDLDDEFGTKASFQIIPEKRYAVPPALLGEIRRRGFEVAVQDLNHDGRLFDSRKEFLRRVEIINRYGREFGARGFRAGVLYRKPEWYDALDFSFDMSIPNVAHLDPQRGGCCTVMPYFIGNVLELPVTTTQDYTLFYLLNQRSIDLWKTQTELILGKNGLVSFIVHPDYVIEPEPRSVYAKLLEYLCCLRERENIWLALPSEIDRWWRERSKMSVVQDGDTFRIEGQGAEKAVLAFATSANGQLVYEFGKTARAC